MLRNVGHAAALRRCYTDLISALRISKVAALLCLDFPLMKTNLSRSLLICAYEMIKISLIMFAAYLHIGTIELLCNMM